MPDIDPRAIGLIMALRKQGITDARVLSAIERTPRELFVEGPFLHSAYENTALPIACGQTISQPYVVALSTLALEVADNMRVLEIGTGSGYQTAVLSRLCRRVYSIERHRPLLLEAEQRFKALKLDNVSTRHGDGFLGWPEQAPFDRILLTAATPEIPDVLMDQLKPNGILVAPVGVSPAFEADWVREKLPKISEKMRELEKAGVIPLHPTAEWLKQNQAMIVEKMRALGLWPSDLESFCQLLTKMIRTETGWKKEALIPVVFVPMVPGVPTETRNAYDGSEKKR